MNKGITNTNLPQKIPFHNFGDGVLKATKKRGGGGDLTPPFTKLGDGTKELTKKTRKRRSKLPMC
jgi:hypothetical protein